MDICMMDSGCSNALVMAVVLVLSLLVMAFTLAWGYTHPVSESFKREWILPQKERMASRLAGQFMRDAHMHNPRGWLRKRWECRTQGTCMSNALTEDDLNEIVIRAKQIHAHRMAQQ